MFNPEIKKEWLIKLIKGMSEDDFARLLYCQQIAATHLEVGQFDEIVLSMILSCKKREIVDGNFLNIKKHKNAKIEQLIQILEDANGEKEGIEYLKWIAAKRDFFVNDIYDQVGFPGDLEIEECRYISRRLVATQHWLRRSHGRIRSILVEAGLLSIHFEGGR